MPFYEARPEPQQLNNLDLKPIQDDPTLLETFGAAFRTENMVGSYLSAKGVANPAEEEEGFNPIDYVKDDSRFAPYADQFAGISNRRAADALKMQITREEGDRRTLDAAGIMGTIASISAGVFDVPTLLPLGGIAAGGAGATQLAGRLAIASGIDAAVSETGLQATQATRTAQETVLNIGGSVVLGGALGGLIGRYLTPSESMSISRKIEGQEQEFDQFERSVFGPNSAGAAARDRGPLVLKDEAIISKLPVISRQDPLIRLQLSELNSGRETVRGLAETPLEYAENAAGVATERGGAVETRIKMWNAPLAEGLQQMDTLFARYYQGAPEPTAWQRRLSPTISEFDRLRGKTGKLTYKEFKEEIGRAAYSGDTHQIPEVAQAAKVYREMDEAMKKAAIEAGLFPEDIKVAGDVSHRFRMYNRQAIIARRDEFTRVLNDYFVTKRDQAATIKAVEGKIDKAAKDAEEFARLSDAEVRSLVDDTINTILGHSEGRMPYDIAAGPRGALKDRVLKIETAKIHDFVQNDIEEVMRAQFRTMSADVELQKKFGSVDLKDQIAKINDEADARIGNAKDAAERKRLEAQRVADVRDVEAIRDRLRGTYALLSNPDGLVLRAGRVARNINYLRLLGGMTISAVPDMAKVVFTHGLTSTFRDGFLPMVKNFQAVKLAGREVKMAGTALDMVLDSRVMALGDITDDFGRHSKFERGLQSLSTRFGVVSLMAPWNASLKQFAGLVTMTNMLRSSQRVALGKGSASDIRKLAAAGIDEDLAGRIARQFSEHGDEQDGVFLAKAADWSDIGAQEAFRSAVVRDVDRIIVTPGQDKPLWMSTELGKTVGQFKSFGTASIQKTLLAGMQQRDAATLNGTMLMLGLGAFTYAMKQMNAEQPLSDNPAVWAVEALDRSGITGWLMDGNNIAEKFTRGRVGFSALTGEQVSRYGSRNVIGSFLGPTPEAIADIFQISGSVFAGDTARADLRRARQLIPGQNLFYLRQLFNQAEQSTGDALNLPEKRKQ